jgi:precorrin-2 dehydrogenase/sirohydrochlorin ferrochelatase
VKLLPIALNIEGKRCLVVGGGSVARRKVESLLECGAKVHIIAPQLCGEFEALSGAIEHSGRTYQNGDVAWHQLVFACTDSRTVNAAVAEEAQRLGIWCSVADDVTGSDFHGAAVVRRGDICVGVTTTGGSPALARHLKARVQECIGPEYAELLEMMSERRAQLQGQMPEQHKRADVWRAILESEALELLKDGRGEEAKKVVDGIIEGHL